MVNLAIRGHATRSKEVIEILEMLGGKNLANYDGFHTGSFYYIGTNNIICYEHDLNELLGMDIYSLEKFLEKYPYKVGDKVVFEFNNTYVTDTIESMEWYANGVVYTSKKYEEELMAEDLQFYKEEETMEESTNKVIFGRKAQSCDIMIEVTKKDIKEIKINIPEDYKVFRIDADNKIVLIKKQPQYPKTYEECCKMLGYSGNYNMILTTDVDNKLFNALYRLKVCRDAYWKIAGEEMGLDKPWKPESLEMNHAIVCREDGDFLLHRRTKAILIFPTEEMRDAFFENFKELIEQCKELL